MKNTETLAINNAENANRERRNDIASEVVNRAAKPLLEDKDLKDYVKEFGEQDPEYNEATVTNDINSVSRKRKRIKETLSDYDPTLPHAVEYLLRGWMDTGSFLDTDNSPERSPAAMRAHDYDDFFNGVDVAKTFYLSDKRKEQCGIDFITMAFDVTISEDKDVISHKMAKFDNGLPYGFTRIKYYAEQMPDSTEIVKSIDKKCVPRFVIGENKTTIGAILDKIKPGHEVEFFKDNSPNSILTRFKILTEVHKEAQLFLDMLSEDEQYSEIGDYLGAIDYMIWPQLEQCVKQMLPGKDALGNPTLPEVPAISGPERKRLENTKDVQEASKIIEQILRDKDCLKYDKTFDQIMSCVEHLDAHPETIQVVASTKEEQDKEDQNHKSIGETALTKNSATD